MSQSNDPAPGINSWLEDELYQTWRNNQKNVDESWKPVFEGNGHGATAKAPVNGGRSPVVERAAQRVPPAPAADAGEELVPMRGIAGKIAENMAASLSVPTATSQRLVPVKVLEESRAALNKARDKQGLSKISYTHLISWAVVQALKVFPQLNDAYVQLDGEHFRAVHKQVNMGIAVDVKQKDGSSTLMVPSIKDAGGLSFAEYVAAFDDIVSRARGGKLQLADFQGTTISLTNPGTVGTFGSVPRLVAGQGAIIATGAMDFPPEFRSAPPDLVRSLGLSKVMMLTCTYDHRIIQGADSGRLLGRIEALLNGEEGFYQTLFVQMGAVQSTVSPSAAPPTTAGADGRKEAAAALLLEAYRHRGHLAADLDPLGSRRPSHPDLDAASYGLSEADLSYPLQALGGKPLRRAAEDLRAIYCGKIAYEYTYLEAPEQRLWLKECIESSASSVSDGQRLRALEYLIRAEEFEKFLNTRFIGKKRFGLEGGEATIAILDCILESAGAGGVSEAVMGMAHRGRLSILANIVGKPAHQVLAEFEETAAASSHTDGSGDVKYHLGASGIHTTADGKAITVSVAFNPSHLEAVDPVVEGVVRSKQDMIGDAKRERVLPILIHGDAAFAAQGVVLETLNMSQLAGYTTGGTIHVIINNQLGFTTSAEEARSSTYCSDIAKSIQAPIFHVNGDDPEAAVRAASLAFEYRQKFKRDVVIDLVCYRRHGHNESDEPGYTQPVMYSKIRKHPSVVTQYTERLIAAGVATKKQVDDRRKAVVSRLAEAFDTMRTHAESFEEHLIASPPVETAPVNTAITKDVAERVIAGLTRFPEGFHAHPKLRTLIERRREVLKGEPFDWATGEAVAFGSLAVEGFHVRLSGQDSGRGTFSQRHLELHDYENAQKYVPLQHIDANQGRFEVYNSPLSEYAVMGYEFGYSLADPRTLVLWEAQFGDFVNGAQITIDQFLSSAEMKWGQPSGLVLLLPHGYEGMGPEHSSARVERFLHLCAENNMVVANCTTPAQYFHILRRQMTGGPDGKPTHKPLILFTPKSILRHPKAVSRIDDLLAGRFWEVLPDPDGVTPQTVKRVLVCTGKIYYELLAAREQKNTRDVAIVRLEQMYPFPRTPFEQALSQYPPTAEVFWVQEEPRNMGAWRFMFEHIQPVLDATKRALSYAGRAESASPAAGMARRHEQEQSELIENAFAPKPVAPRPRRVRVVAKKKTK